MSDEDLLQKLWESDEASALTNQAARRIEELEANLRNMALDYLAAEGQAAEAYQAQLLAEARLVDAEVKLEELLVVAKRAVRLSMDYADFKLYAMESMHQAIAAAQLKGEDRG